MATRTIETDIVLGGEKEFNAAMKSVNSNLAVMRSDMAALSSEFSENEDAVTSLTSKQKLLDAAAEQQAEKARILGERYAAVAKAYGENSAQADRAKIAWNQAVAAQNKSAAAAQKNAEALQKAREETRQYTTVASRLKGSFDDTRANLKALADQFLAAARNTPVLADALEALGATGTVAGKGLEVAGTAVNGLGSAAAGLGKGVGLFSAGAMAGVAALGVVGVVAAGQMVSFAKESAEAAKAAKEAGETLTDSQQEWLAFSDQLDGLDAAVAGAKSSLGQVLLPALSELSSKGTVLLETFSAEMEAAAGNTEAQGEIMGRYIVEGAQLIINSLPEYIEAGKALFGGVLEGLGEEGPMLLEQGGQLVLDLLNEIIAYAPQMAESAIHLVESLISGMTDKGPDVLASAVQMVTKIVSGLAQAAPTLIPAAVNLVMTLISTLVQEAPALLEAGLELVFGIIAGITAGLGDILNVADQLIDELINQFRASDNEWLQFGADIIEGIKNGIKSAWSALVDWFNDLWDSLFSNRTVDVNVNQNGGGNSHATGLSYVPYDNYPANLHEGEMVLTRAQANLFRRGLNPVTVTGGDGTASRTVNLNFYAKTITEAEINMVCEIVNRKLGEAI